MRPPYTSRLGPGPFVAVAIHAGHDLRPEIARRIALDEQARLREEDPGTDAWTVIAPSRVVAHRSRFEVDLNRPRDLAVYETPDEAWGLEVWKSPLPGEVAAGSLTTYDRFYEDLSLLLASVIMRWGGVLVYDLHSYNHRRAGPSGLPAPPDENPDVNVGTGWIDVDLWRPVVSTLLEAAGRGRVGGRPVDARENVRFRGGHLSHWVSDTFPGRACVLAIEVKKTFMDEWTGRIDEERTGEVRALLAATVPSVVEVFRQTLEARRKGGGVARLGGGIP